MPNFMVKVLSDRLQLTNGKIVKEYLHSELFDQTGLTGTDKEKMRKLEDNARPALQDDIEDVTPLTDISNDDPVKTEPEKYVKYGDAWPSYIKGTDQIVRLDTIDVRVTNLDPLNYVIWLGDARIYKLPSINWWI